MFGEGGLGFVPSPGRKSKSGAERKRPPNVERSGDDKNAKKIREEEGGCRGRGRRRRGFNVEEHTRS